MFISPLLKWLRFHLSIQWPPVWARRPKPTRPAGAERPPLFLGSPYAAEPQGSWSPDFSVRVVTQTRGGAGKQAERAAAWLLAGVPAATQALKGSVFLVRGRSPQRQRGCCEVASGPPPAGWFSQGFFFLPRLSFSRTKKKDGVRAPHWRERDAGYYPAYQRNPDRAFRPKRPSISAARRSPACLGDNTPIVHGIPLGRWFPPSRR